MLPTRAHRARSQTLAVILDLVVVVLVLIAACGPPASERGGPEPHITAPAPASSSSAAAPARAHEPAVVRGRLRLESGAAPDGWTARLESEAPQPVGADGRFVLAVPEWRRRAPALRISVGPEAGPRASTTLPRHRVPDADLDLLIADGRPGRPVYLEAPTDPTLAAWVEVSAWANQSQDRWMATRREHEGDPAARARAQAELLAALARDLDGDPDPERRALRQLAQFKVGSEDRSDARRAAALAALEARPLLDPLWGYEPTILAVALTAAGRWDSSVREIDALIGGASAPELAAYLALERYISTSAAGEWASADAVWAAYQGRPELAGTAFAELLESVGPTRPLAPGHRLAPLCGLTLDGAARCVPAPGQLTVVDLWATWCTGCVEAMPAVKRAADQLRAEAIDVAFVALNPYEDAATIAAFRRDHAIEGEVLWLESADQRAALRGALGLESIPRLALIAGDGRVLASSPALQPERLVEVVRRWARS